MWNCRLLGLQEKAAQSHVAGAWAGSPNPTPKENEASSPELLLLLLSFFAFLFSLVSLLSWLQGNWQETQTRTVETLVLRSLRLPVRLHFG